jgi:hypothetical protein
MVEAIEAATDCGVAEDGAHRALADARMTLGVLRCRAAPHERTATGRAESGHRPAGGFALCFRMKLYFKE